VLRVRGMSMIDEQIRDGDFVVVNDRGRADNGETVIALIDGTSATVKKYYRERDGRIRLQPANQTMEPIYVNENDVKIQGVVVGVLRRY
jgi:repressor LexA